jgi:uncharacterized protein
MTDTLSPCQKICALDATKAWCTACGRTLDEITNWSQMKAVERRAIMGQLPDRLARLKG